MSSVLFVTCDAGGNVPPVLAVAAEMQSRGHDVRVMGHPAQEQAVADAGLPFNAFATARAFRGAKSNSPFAWVAMFGDRAMGRDVAAEVKARRTDLVAVDCMAFGAIEAVAASGTPYVLLEHTFHEYWAHSWLTGPMGIGLRLKRFRTQQLVDAARARVVLALRELDPTTAPAPNAVHVGPVVSGVPAEPAEPTVLVSLSTISFPGMRKTLQRAVDALADLPVRGIVTTGPVIDPSTLRAPANVELHRYVPHADLMPKVSVLIGHGGHATTMTALAHDVPVVVLPLHPLLDQKMVGAAVERAGAGRLLNKSAKAKEIADAVSQLLGDGAYRAAAARLGREIRAASGAARAGDLLESLMANGVAVAPRP